MRTFPHMLLLLLALAFTLLNAVKPLTIDDTYYRSVAAQLAQRPLDPYGYAAYWWFEPEVANEVLAPPLLPYWWSLAIRLSANTHSCGSCGCCRSPCSWPTRCLTCATASPVAWSVPWSR